jgi:hypothetical protein
MVGDVGFIERIAMNKSNKSIVGPYKVYFQIWLEDKVEDFITLDDAMDFIKTLHLIGVGMETVIFDDDGTCFKFYHKDVVDQL